MKFSCSTGIIADAFQLVAGVVPSRSLKPILTRAKMTVREGAVTVEGTDLEVAVRTGFPPGTVEREGAVAVPAAKMASILGDARDEEIRIEAERDVVTVLCRDGFYRVLGEPVENFPPISQFQEGGVKLPGKVLGDMMKKTAMAAAEERSRYSLNGVYLSVSGKKITMAATDGRRLAVREEKLGSKAEDASGIIPLKGIATIRRVVEEAEEAELSLTENMVMVRGPGSEVYSRLIEGKFPDYERVVPSGNDNRVTLGREDLLSLVRRAAVLCSGESRAVRFSVEKDTLKISSRTAEVGEAELSIPVSYGGSAIEIDFNPDYIADVLRVLVSDEVTLELKDGECAGLIREGKQYTYVIMPLSA